MEDYCITVLQGNNPFVFNFVEFTFVFRNYVRRFEKKKKIKLCESLPRIACSINVTNHLKPVLCFFIKEPQTALKVILTFQYFKYFFSCITRWVHCKYYTSVSWRFHISCKGFGNGQVTCNNLKLTCTILQ